ncbi:hypothetical protein HDV04_001933 [Boothiomyces sp. JEL0838]|nr:hypothetical protein HDV04_001908 [Boothiomyces sp. JEL0838]KAJ3313504.1 hypothetical protein HDV04_001933 [Boothiomyces sp. JEL0838]
MKKILVTRRLPPLTQLKLESLNVKLEQWDSYTDPIPRDVLLKQLPLQDGLLCMLTDKIDSEALKGTNLQAISTVSVGMDHIDQEECKKRNILLGNTPDVLTDHTAELCMGLLLATLRKFPSAIDSVRNGSWSTWDPVWMCGSGLRGKSVGIIGLGRIGQAIAERIVPFKPKEILYSGQTRKDTTFKSKFVGFEELIKSSDVVICSCALTPKTKHLIRYETIKQMKPSAYLINIARGGILDQDGLVRALEEGHLSGVGLDVTDPEPLDPKHPLVTKFGDKCMILPHIGSATMETREAMADLALEKLLQNLGINN